MLIVPSVHWHCWLGCRKGIRPIKNWVVGCWHGYLSGARCRLGCVCVCVLVGFTHGTGMTWRWQMERMPVYLQLLNIHTHQTVAGTWRNRKLSWDNTQRETTLLHTFNGHLSETTRVSRYQKGKTNLHFTEGRDSEWQWHQLGRIQDCTSLQTDNHTSTQPLSFFTGRMPFLLPNQQHQRTEGTRTWN